MTGATRRGPDNRRSPVNDFRQDYRVAFLRHLSRRDEVTRASGYDLGRRAVDEGVSLLHMVSVHHALLSDVLASSPDDPADIVTAGGSFLLEVLAAADMAQRGLRDDRTPSLNDIGAPDGLGQHP